MPTIRYNGDDGAPVHVTGVVGGRIPGDGYVVQSFSEVPELEEEVYEYCVRIDGHGVPDFRREVVASIAMTERATVRSTMGPGGCSPTIPGRSATCVEEVNG